MKRWIQGKGSQFLAERNAREDSDRVGYRLQAEWRGRSRHSPSSIYAGSGRSYATVHQETKATRIGSDIGRKKKIAITINCRELRGD